MQSIDVYSYQCGVMDAFSEVVSAGVKRIALSHPCDTAEERDRYLPFAEQLCKQYGNVLYLENEGLLTELFPLSLNKGKFNMVFAHKPEDLTLYRELRQRKKELVEKNLYFGEARRRLAFDFGRLLSYSEEAIERLIRQNQEKE